MFEKATRLKIRFSTTGGGSNLNCEDLWDLPLLGKGLSLDSLARNLYKKIKTDEEISFVKVMNPADKVLKLKFDIVKHVIDTRLAEMDVRENEHEIKIKKEKLLSAKAEKQNEELKGKSVEELDKMIEELG